MPQLPAAFSCHSDELVLDPLAVGLHHEVDDRGGPAPRRGPGAGLERVGGERAPERHLHVGVAVDPTRDHILAWSRRSPLGGRRDVTERGRGRAR